MGLRVLVLEKAARLGGTSAMSVGSLMAAGTRMQRAAGVIDSPDQHEAELIDIVTAAKVGDNPALRRLLVENMGETVDFLERIGVHFLGPLPQPPFTTSRFYQALPGGRVYIQRLAEECARLGVELRMSAAVETLERDGDRVSGVTFSDPTGSHRVVASHGVILASGDVSGNRAMRREIWGEGLDALEPINPNAMGDGQRLGQSVGGRLVLRDDLVPHGVPRFSLPTTRPLAERLPLWRPLTRAMKLALSYLPQSLVRPFVLRAAMTALAPERALYAAGAVVVNQAGNRFVDELGPVGDAIARQPGGVGYVLFDSKIARRFSKWPDFVSTAPGIAYAYVDDYRGARPDIFHEAATLEELASVLGCPHENLATALAFRNDSPEPPFILMGPLKTWLLLTPAGLAIDTSLRVLDDNNTPIPGLYAAGGAGQGGLSFTHYYHGHSLGWALTSGRLAARAAANSLSAQA